MATVWPEPFNFFKTPPEQKTSATFSFDEDGVLDAISWMIDRLFEIKDVRKKCGLCFLLAYKFN